MITGDKCLAFISHKFAVFMDNVFVKVVAPAGNVLIDGRTVCVNFRPREDVTLENGANRFVIGMANGADDRVRGALF